jgi:two-component system cell cycle response regulator
MKEMVKTLIFEKYFDKENIGLLIISNKKIEYMNDKIKEFAKLFDEDFEKTNPIDIFFYYKEYIRKNKNLQQFKSLVEYISLFRNSNIEMNNFYVTEFKGHFLEFHFDGVIIDKQKYYIISVFDVTNDIKLLDYKYLDVSRKINELVYNNLTESNFNKKELYKKIYELLKKYEIIDEMLIATLDEKENNKINIDFGIIDGKKLTGSFLNRKDKSLSAYIIDTKKKVYIPDSLNYKLPKGYNIKHVGIPKIYSVYGVPLINEKGESYGVILYERPKVNSFNSNDFKLLDEVTYAIQTAMKFQNLYKKLYEEKIKYYEISIRDYLTRAYSRVYLEEYLKNAYQNVKRYGEKFVISFIDINDFKKINDKYGHDFGDMVLSIFSEVVINNIRESDIFARYGGDEFIIVFSNSNEDDAIKVMKRIEKKLLSQEIPIKISYGIQSINPLCSLEENLRIVDKKMYEMKKTK